ncbi:SiaB family protein kinase [Halocola ammonii]
MSSISDYTLPDLAAVIEQLYAQNFESEHPHKIIFSYQGSFSTRKVDSTLELVEEGILESGGKRKIMKRICSVLIEVLQNGTVHSAKDKEGRPHNTLIINSSTEHFQIIAGNLILNEEANPIRKKIEAMNKLSRSELRKLYIETLCNEEFSTKGGAGLGFLTMAKKSESPIEFSIDALNDTLSYFVLRLSFNR